MDYIYIRWSRGVKTEKSIKVIKKDNNIRHQEYTIDKKEIINKKTHDCFEKVVEIKENKKDICSQRMADRQLIAKSNINPYMVANNYLDDLKVQSQFLIPKNSNFGE
jgi:hypothetical protein